jgi:hypothetical protein
MYMTNLYIEFCNSTPFPVIIEAWENAFCGLNILGHTRIEPHKTTVIHSIVGEWHIQTFFDRKDDVEAWQNAGYACGYYLGKFRSDACASGNYAWMENDNDFECVYTQFTTPMYISEDEKIDGLITFRQLNTEWKDVQDELPEQLVCEPTS